ncbi:hypothetical protein B0A49_00042 [Cryomyces minteri]|uniref:Uncharacterized protein n=1 Tax=Cryomyces minteri TaxID=331657 RepID=A0A4U0Y2W0_9PEZI|nr:hypothetical protein B0A49_00042 [Cryomyces minteri]
MSQASGVVPLALTEYVVPPSGNKTPKDSTSFLPSQATWSEDNLDPSQGVLEHIPFTPRSVIGFRQNDQGEPIIHEWSGRKIRIFDDLPDRISTSVEGGRMDLWFRKDSRITMSDIIDRMNPKFIKNSDLPKLPTLDDSATKKEYEKYGDPYTDANKIARLQAKKTVRKNTVDMLLTRRLSNRVARFRQQHNLLAPETRRIDQTPSGEDMKKVNNLSEEKRLANVAWEIEGDKMFQPQPTLKRNTVSNYQGTRYPLPARLNPTGYSPRVAAIVAELGKEDALASLKDRRNPRNQDKRKQTIAEKREKRKQAQMEIDETDQQSHLT